MARLVFVHGMFATGRSWFGVPGLLHAKGHEVSVVELPGHRLSDVEQTSDVTMDDYVEDVSKHLSDTQESVLIGHSMGGAVMSHVAADPGRTGKIKELIYVTAMVPDEGETISDINGKLNLTGEEIKAEFRTLGLGAIEAFGLQPSKPMATPFTANDAFKDLEKRYIYCDDDKIIKPDEQASMAAKWDIPELGRIDTGHMVPHTEPTQLADIIHAHVG